MSPLPATVELGSTASMRRMRFDNVGSLVRPERLRAAFAGAAAGTMDPAELAGQQAAAVGAVLAEQHRRGYPVCVDGEFRRRVFTESFSLVEGLSDWADAYAGSIVAIDNRDRDRAGRWGAPSHELRVRVTAPMRLTANVPLQHWSAAQALTPVPVKPTLVGVERIFQTLDYDGSAAVYPDRWELLDAVVAVQRDIIAGLVDAGCRYIQIDAPGFTAYVDEPSRARLRSRGFDPDALMTRAVAAENAAIEGFDGVCFGIHLCRGNQHGHWHREGPYDDIAEELFSGLRHDRLLLEYDTERAGTFAPLRHVPKDKTAVLGLVTTKDPRVETASELERRVEQAGHHIDIDQVAISPQCGFESSLGGQVLTADDQWRKLDVLLELGRKLWPTSDPADQHADPHPRTPHDPDDDGQRP